MKRCVRYGVLNIILVLLSLIVTGSVQAQSAADFTLRTDATQPHRAIALILPGMGHHTQEPAYLAIGGFYQACSVTPVYVDFKWRQVHINNLADTAETLARTITAQYPGARVRLFGFSVGAALAFKVSEALPSDQVVLCSMSPVFVEDCEQQSFPFRPLTRWMADFSHNRMTWAQHPALNYCFFYGEHESMLINSAIIKKRENGFPGSPMRVVEAAGHELTPAYLLEIERVIGEVP